VTVGLDAWSLLGITDLKNSGPPREETYTEVAPLGSHCVGLYPEMPGEVPGAKRIRDRALELFKSWGGS